MAKNNKQKVGKVAGVPYDWRKPTKPRLLSRIWNPKAPLFTPKWWGWGYDLNWYVVFHPVRHHRTKGNR